LPDVVVRDLPKAHPLLGMPGQNIAIFLYGLPQAGNID
jgi:hypothetical protein